MVDWSNKEEVLEQVKITGTNLNYASTALKGDFDVVLAAVKDYGFAIAYASDELQNNKTIVLAAFNQNEVYTVLDYASDEIKNDKDFMVKLIKKNPKTIQYIGDTLKNDEKFILKILDDSIVSKFKGQTFKVVNDETYQNKVFTYKELIVKFTNYSFITESNEIRKGVKQLQNASTEVKNNKDFMLEMIEKDPKNIQYIGDYNPLRNDKEFMLKMTEKDPKNIQYIKSGLKNDKDFMLKMIEKDLKNIQYIESGLKNDKEFIMKIFEIANSKEKLEISVIELIANIYNEKKDIPGWNKIIEFCEKHFLKYVTFANKILDNSLKKGDYFAMWKDKSPKEPKASNQKPEEGLGGALSDAFFSTNSWINDFSNKFKWETNNNPLDYLSKNIQTIMVHLYNENEKLNNKFEKYDLKLEELSKENKALKQQLEKVNPTPQNNSLKNFNALANQILNTDIKVTDGPNKEIFVTKKDLCGNFVALEKELEKEIEEGFETLNKYVENRIDVNLFNLLTNSLELKGDTGAKYNLKSVVDSYIDEKMKDSVNKESLEKVLNKIKSNFNNHTHQEWNVRNPYEIFPKFKLDNLNLD